MDGEVVVGYVFYTLAVPSLRNAYTAAEGNEEALAVLDIWNVFMFHRMTDSWGPIAYSEAGLGGTEIAYDLQEDMYDEFFTLLDAAEETLSGINGTVGVFRDYDAIYGGDTELWRKFANSMRLRLALRISDVDPARAQTEAEAAVAAGVMDSNDDCAYFEATSDTYNNFIEIAGAWGFYMTADMESILGGYNDPRMAVWYSANADGEYVGQPNGGATIRDWDNDILSALNRESVFADSNTKDIEVMMAAESYFSRAEGVLKGWNMGGDAQTLYEEGIRLSMNQWGVTEATAINTYLAGTSTGAIPTLSEEYTKVGKSATPPVDVPVAWAGTEAEQLKQIAVQKYLALFPESWETWSDLRRSDADILYPLLNTEDVDGNDGLMRRLIYVPTEYSTNEAAVNAAVSSLPGGEDKGSARVWWDVN